MNRPNITAIALDTATVLRWIQDAANCEAFVFPVDVVGIQVDEDITHLDIRPRTERIVETIHTLADPFTPPEVVFYTVTGGENGNGNGHKSARGTRIITEEHKEYIRAHADQTGQQIADHLGVPASAVYPYLAQSRKEAKQQPAPAAQPFQTEA